MRSRDPLSIRQIEVFVALVEQRSFTRAARHLHLSQSTVSGHIADLERRLGVRLVERERKGVRTTAAGDALLGPARDVLHAERNARLAIEELSGLLKGTLTVGGSTIPAAFLLPAMLARFHAAYPGVKLAVQTGDSKSILDRVRETGLEVGVVGSAPTTEDLESMKVGQDSLVLVMNPGHDLARRESLEIRDLLAAPMVMREEGSGTRAATERALRRLLGEGTNASIPVACEVGSTEALKAAVGAGLGLAFISNLAVGSELAAGALVSRPVEGFDVVRSFFLVSRPASYLSPAARAFRDLVRPPLR